MILIVGGTGVLGQRAARLLLADGHRVRVMTRNPRRAADLQKQGADVVVADLVDPETLLRACTGADRVLAAAHSMIGRGRYNSERVDGAGHRALVDAAKAAHVARFVYVSARGASPSHPVDFFRTKYEVEQYLRRSGLDHVVLRPSAFMEWHAHQFNGKQVLRRGWTLLLGSPTKRRNFVAAGDVALLAAKALFDPGLSGHVIDVGAPGDYTDREVATLYASLADVSPRIVHLPARITALLSYAIKPFHPGIARILRLASVDEGYVDEQFHAGSLVARNLMQFTSLDAFVRDQVRVARGGSAVTT